MNAPLSPLASDRYSAVTAGIPERSTEGFSDAIEGSFHEVIEPLKIPASTAQSSRRGAEIPGKIVEHRYGDDGRGDEVDRVR